MHIHPALRQSRHVFKASPVSKSSLVGKFSREEREGDGAARALHLDVHSPERIFANSFRLDFPPSSRIRFGDGRTGTGGRGGWTFGSVTSPECLFVEQYFRSVSARRYLVSSRRVVREEQNIYIYIRPISPLSYIADRISIVFFGPRSYLLLNDDLCLSSRAAYRENSYIGKLVSLFARLGRTVDARRISNEVEHTQFRSKFYSKISRMCARARADPPSFEGNIHRARYTSYARAHARS